MDELAPAERAELYRSYAEQAISDAKNAASEEIRQGYLKIAEDWLALADSIEAHYGSVGTYLSAEGSSAVRKV